MIVILNNGTRIKVDQETVQAIFGNILGSEGAKQWQTISNGKGLYLMGFNLKDVSAICKEEDIL